MATGTYVLECDFTGNDNFLDANENITADTLSVECVRGRDYASQLTGRSVAGRLRAVLRNDSGKYSSLNASSPLTGLLLPGRKVRLRSVTPNAANLWTGYLERIQPISEGGFPTALLEASGPIGRLNGKRVNPPASAGDEAGPLIGTVLDDAGWPAGERTLENGQTTTSRWFVQDKDALNAIQELEETELGFFYEAEDGKLTFEDRHHRLKGDHLTSQATYSDAAAASLPYLSIIQADPLREIFNEVRATIQVYNLQALAVLWTFAGETPVLGPGMSTIFWASYPGPDDVTGSYVDAWTTPVVGTDITQTGVSNGNISVAASKFANSMKITVTNNHATKSATLTLLQARGTAVTRGDPKTIVSEDATSQTKHGKRTYRLPGIWYNGTNDATALADYILSRYKDPQPILTLALAANGSSSLMTEALTRKISDRVTIVATGIKTQLGISSRAFFIESIEHQLRLGDEGYTHITKFLCSLADAQSYWVLGTSSLGVDTRLAA